MKHTIFHIILHFLVPFAVARTIWKKKWFQPFIVMACTIAVDLDHLMADPFFDPKRCSISAHPLHSWTAIFFYLACLLTPKLRILALGLLIHMSLDGADCLF